MLPSFLKSRAVFHKVAPLQPVAILDSVDDGAVADSAKSFAMQTIATQAVAAVQDWAETTPADLDDGETLADRLFAMMVGIADENMDGELSDSEQAVVETAMNVAWDYLASKGASDDDIDALLNGDGEAAAAAADRVQQVVVENLPEGDDAAADDMDNFAFGEGQESVFDGILDAVYKKKVVIRKGKKVRVMKRVSGTVRLTSKQRLAIKKAGLKSRSSAAMAKRMKSMRKRTQMGLNK